MTDLALVYDHNEQATTDSRKVAEFFGKTHDKVLRDIRELDCSEEFRLANFGESSYRNEQNKKQPMCLMTRDGFALLAFGYTGKKAMAFKEAYIKQFNLMEARLLQIHEVKRDFRELTDAIKMAHDEIHSYHFSNEFDLINRVALGTSTKQFKRQHNITGDSIRPYLSAEQLDMVNKLQRFDSGLVVLVPQYEARKAMLIDYRDRVTGRALNGTQSVPQ